MRKAATYDDLDTEIVADFVWVAMDFQFGLQHLKMGMTDIKNIRPEVVAQLIVPEKLVDET